MRRYPILQSAPSKQILLLPLSLNEAFFSIMQNKTDKGSLLVSKSLLVVILNSVNRLLSAIKTNGYVSSSGRLFSSLSQRPQSTFSTGGVSLRE